MTIEGRKSEKGPIPWVKPRPDSNQPGLPQTAAGSGDCVHNSRLSYRLPSNGDPCFSALIASRTLMKEPHIAPENNRKTHSSEYLMSAL